MSDIFISYAIEDLDRIKPLVKALEEMVWSVWWDRSMLPGSRWQRVLRDAIGAAKCVIVAGSETSIASEWVEIEAEEGRRRGILVPVLIDDVVPPFPFGGIHAARLVRWKGNAADGEFQTLVRAISYVAVRPNSLKQVATGDRGQREEGKAIELIGLVPSRERVLAQLLFLISAPARRVAASLNSPAQQLINVIEPAASSAGQARSAGQGDFAERRGIAANHN